MIGRPVWRRIIWIVTIGYWLVLLTATHLPPNHLPDTHVSDKLEHLAAYGLLAGLLCIAFISLPIRAMAIRVMLIVLLDGAFDEWTQPIFGRSCELNDWLADATGTAIAVAIVVMLRLVVSGNSKLQEPKLKQAPMNQSDEIPNPRD